MDQEQRDRHRLSSLLSETETTLQDLAKDKREIDRELQRLKSKLAHQSGTHSSEKHLAAHAPSEMPPPRLEGSTSADAQRAPFLAAQREATSLGAQYSATQSASDQQYGRPAARTTPQPLSSKQAACSLRCENSDAAGAQDSGEVPGSGYNTAHVDRTVVPEKAAAVQQFHVKPPAASRPDLIVSEPVVDGQHSGSVAQREDAQSVAFGCEMPTHTDSHSSGADGYALTTVLSSRVLCGDDVHSMTEQPVIRGTPLKRGDARLARRETLPSMVKDGTEQATAAAAEMWGRAAQAALTAAALAPAELSGSQENSCPIADEFALLSSCAYAICEGLPDEDSPSASSATAVASEAASASAAISRQALLHLKHQQQRQWVFPTVVECREDGGVISCSSPGVPNLGLDGAQPHTEQPSVVR